MVEIQNKNRPPDYRRGLVEGKRGLGIEALRWVDWGCASALIWREDANEKVLKSDKK
jgi:hypothetical protein